MTETAAQVARQHVGDSRTVGLFGLYRRRHAAPLSDPATGGRSSRHGAGPQSRASTAPARARWLPRLAARTRPWRTGSVPLPVGLVARRALQSCQSAPLVLSANNGCPKSVIMNRAHRQPSYPDCCGCATVGTKSRTIAPNSFTLWVANACRCGTDQGISASRPAAPMDARRAAPALQRRGARGGS